jgi:hypothetical protein
MVVLMNSSFTKSLSFIVDKLLAIIPIDMYCIKVSFEV